MGFKWFVPGLLDGSFGFGGEESAGASFLRLRRHACGRPTRTASCSTCSPPRSPPRPGKDPGEHYRELRPSTARPSTRASTPRRRPRRRSASRRSSPDAVTRRDRSPATPSRAKLTQRAVQRRGHRRAEGDDRQRAGSPRGRRGRRTSTRSTRRASAARSTSGGSWRRRRRSSTRRLAPRGEGVRSTLHARGVWRRAHRSREPGGERLAADLLDASRHTTCRSTLTTSAAPLITSRSRHTSSVAPRTTSSSRHTSSPALLAFVTWGASPPLETLRVSILPPFGELDLRPEPTQRRSEPSPIPTHASCRTVPTRARSCRATTRRSRSTVRRGSSWR